MTITNKEIIEIILEVRSHSGLPIRYFYPAAELLVHIRQGCTFTNHSLIDHLKDSIINQCMIEIHKCKNKNINKNIKSYDW